MIVFQLRPSSKLAFVMVPPSVFQLGKSPRHSPDVEKFWSDPINYVVGRALDQAQHVGVRLKPLEYMRQKKLVPLDTQPGELYYLLSKPGFKPLMDPRLFEALESFPGPLKAGQPLFVRNPRTGELEPTESFKEFSSLYNRILWGLKTTDEELPYMHPTEVLADLRILSHTLPKVKGLDVNAFRQMSPERFVTSIHHAARTVENLEAMGFTKADLKTMFESVSGKGKTPRVEPETISGLYSFTMKLRQAGIVGPDKAIKPIDVAKAVRGSSRFGFGIGSSGDVLKRYTDEKGQLNVSKLKTHIFIGKILDTIYQKLLVEKNPLAWGILIAVGAGFIALLLSLFRRRPQQQLVLTPAYR